MAEADRQSNDRVSFGLQRSSDSREVSVVADYGELRVHCANRWPITGSRMNMQMPVLTVEPPSRRIAFFRLTRNVDFPGKESGRVENERVLRSDRVSLLKTSPKIDRGGATLEIVQYLPRVPRNNR